MSLFVLYGILTGISVICLGLMIFSVSIYANNRKLDRRVRRLEWERRRRKKRNYRPREQKSNTQRNFDEKKQVR